ncbi:MAG: LysR substrate-binding domain-containing protein [Lautropia sp.]|nr:LysR substrate-binding domain-containing protein [Lautropia sp.]
MQDLNDLAYFVAVADHGGFAAAGRALDIPKSKLSRRIAMLEARLGVRLIQRTTRRFAVTDTGKDFLQHCRAMLVEAEAAEAVVAEQSSMPRGTVRLSCPPALMQYAVGDMLADILNGWPLIKLHVQATNRHVDVWESGVDLALRVRAPDSPLPAEETVKPLAISPHLLVVAPQLLSNTAPPSAPEDLNRLPTVGLGNAPSENIWTLTSPTGTTVRHTHQPRLVVDDMAALKQAVCRGVGCAELPRMMVHDELAAGTLLPLLPDWQASIGVIQAAFATRRGMRPAVRQVLDALGAAFLTLAEEGRCLKVPA